MIDLKKKDCEKKRKVEFYSHVVVTTRKTGLHVIGFCTTAKGYFQTRALRHFWAVLLPAAVVEGRRSDLL